MRQGQITVAFLGGLVLLLSFSVALLLKGIDRSSTVRNQNRLDAISLTGCSFLSAELNRMARINASIGKIRWTMPGLLAYWNGLALCVAACPVGVGCACLPPFLKASVWVPKRLRQLSRLGKALERGQDFMRQMAGVRAVAKMKRVAHRNGVRKVELVPPVWLDLQRAGRKEMATVQQGLSSLIQGHTLFSTIRFPTKLVLGPRAVFHHRVLASRRIDLEEGKRRVVSLCGVQGVEMEEGSSETFREVLLK